MASLEHTISVQQTAQMHRLSVIKMAEGFNLEHVIHRYMKDFELPEDVAREHARELVRFLTICALNPDVVYGMAGAVDKFWHTFVMYTKEYAEFCDAVAGRFIHHVPDSPDDDALSTPRLRDNYLKFLEDYEEVFGDPPPSHIWPNPQGKLYDLNRCTNGACSRCTNSASS